MQPSGGGGAAGAGMTGGEAAAAATASGFERIVLDTAPTGHTLRLLAFPVFLDNLLTKLISLRARLQGAVSLLGGLMGADNPAAKIDAAVEKLQRWQACAHGRSLGRIHGSTASSRCPTSTSHHTSHTEQHLLLCTTTQHYLRYAGASGEPAVPADGPRGHRLCGCRHPQPPQRRRVGKVALVARVAGPSALRSALQCNA